MFQKIHEMQSAGTKDTECVLLLQNVFSYYRMCSSGDAKRGPCITKEEASSQTSNVSKHLVFSKHPLVFPNIYVSEHPMCPKTTQTYVYVSKDLCLFVQRPMFKIYVYVSKDQRSRRSKASNVFIYRMCSLTIECVLLL